jgi:hypothetical protein
MNEYYNFLLSTQLLYKNLKVLCAFKAVTCPYIVSYIIYKQKFLMLFFEIKETGVFIFGVIR